MADHYRVVTDAPGFGKRMGDSFKGILSGVVIFALAFPLLWWGENRKNEAEFVDEAQMVSSVDAPTVAAKTLVKTTGQLTTSDTLTDPEFLVASGNFDVLELERDVEMYAWVEKKHTEKEGNKEVTTYDYEKDWVGYPADSSKFYDGAGHKNPKLTIKDKDFQVRKARIGNVALAADKATFFGSKEWSVEENLLNPGSGKILQLSGGEIFIPYQNQEGRSVAGNPQIGDVKISYDYFPANVEGSVVGDWDGQKIVPHVYDKTNTFFGVYEGNLDEFRAYLESRHNMITWVIRIIAFLMMWGGLNAVLGPILTVMDSIPLIGGAGRAVISFVTGVIAFVLWGLTLVLANLWLLLLAVAVLGGLAFFAMRKKNSAQTAPAG